MAGRKWISLAGWARILALRGADVILMPHAACEGRWQDNPQSEGPIRALR
jgi:hypothetical protein